MCVIKNYLYMISNKNKIREKKVIEKYKSIKRKMYL